MAEWALNGPTPPPPPAHCNYKLQTIHKDQQRDMESEQRDMQAEGHWTSEEGVYFLASALTGGWDMVKKDVWLAETPTEDLSCSGPRKQRVEPGAIREMRKWGIAQKRGDLNSVFEHCTRQGLEYSWLSAGYTLRTGGSTKSCEHPGVLMEELGIPESIPQGSWGTA